MQRCEARGWQFDVGQFNQRLDGIAEVTDEGKIVRTAGLQRWLATALDEQNEEMEDGGARLQMAATPATREKARNGLYQSFIREGGGKRQRIA